MGQTCCKECGEVFKKSAVVDWDDEDDGHDTYSTGVNSSLRSSPPSHGTFDPKRSKRIKHKKRTVALHAEFRDRQGMLLAPPMVSEDLMENTDNVFSGQDLGVDTLHYGSSGALQAQDQCDNTVTIADNEGHQLLKVEKTPEEDAFLDRALGEDDNFVFDGLTDRAKIKLKDNMERILVPKNTLLIRKGDEPDYMYLVLEGEIAVYIDPDEYVDENAEQQGKHAPIDISLKRLSSQTSMTSAFSSKGESIANREFKQSYVLQLRKSMFATGYEGGHGEVGEGNGNNDNGIVGQVLSLVRESYTNESYQGREGSCMSNLTGIIEDTSTGSEDYAEAAFFSLSELRGLKHERDLGPMDVCGDLGLMYNCPRTASCLTTTNCILYRIEGELFKQILSSSNTEIVKKRCTESRSAVEALCNIGIVEDIDEQALKDIQSVLNPVTFEQDDLVTTKGARDGLMFFVMSGKLRVYDVGTGDSRKADIELGEGGHFGELNLLNEGQSSLANISVLSPKARLMVVTKKDFRKRRESLEPLMRKLWRRNAILAIPVIAKSKLLPHEINALVNKLEKISFPRGKITLTGEMRTAIFIVESGKIQLAVTDGEGVVNTFDKHDHFGSRSLFDAKFFEKKTVNLKAVYPAECLMLTKKAIINVVGRITRLGKPSLPVSRKLIKNMKLSDLTLHRIIGVGMFGRVWLVQHKHTDGVFALKVMDKKEIIDKKMTKGVLREKNVMASVEHPFLSDLISTFQDKHLIFMLMNYVQGGELFGLIYNVSKKGYLSNDAAAFYGACLAEALSHLHSRSICHRDIKPENILINAAGYVVLADFGFAKVVLDRTFTTCGSPEYMAPEILLGKGHSLSVDGWALGVLIYEMLVGQTPFIHVGATRMTLFRRICNSTFAFPNGKKHGINVTDSSKVLIRGLLNKNESERLGSSLTLGDEEITTHSFFQGLLTEYRTVFLAEKITPPWLPDINSELDTSYFSMHDGFEKEVRSKTKNDVLDKKAQAMFSGFEKYYSSC